MRSVVRYVVLSVPIFLCVPLLAQEGLSTIRGTVTDPTGAIVPGATLSLEEVETKVRARTATSDEQGNFEMPGLKLGTYRLTATVTGFKTFVETDIVLRSNQVRRVDIRLEVGATDTEVTVSGRSAVIETEQGKIASDVRHEQYKELPIPANAYSAPGPVLAVLPMVQAGTYAGQGGYQVHMGMDGVKEENTNTQTVNMEDVDEMKLVTVNNTAEFARVAYFDTVSKHGSNEFHAEASYYHRNSALGARNFFEDTKTRDLYHTFNLAASGPVIKNKTFFYVLWNGERVPGKGFHLISVPTAAFRGGDFSQLLNLSKPVTLLDPLSGTPFPGNKIPANRISGVSQKLQDYIPSPNRGGSDALVNNFSWAHPYTDDQYRADVITARGDHNITSKNSIYGRLSAYLPRYVLAGNYPTFAWTRLRQSHSWAIIDTHLFSPRVVNIFTFGGNRDRLADDGMVNGVQPPSGAQVVKDLGIQGVNQKGITGNGGFPTTNITGYPSLDLTGLPLQIDRNFSFADSLNASIGKHVVKFGGEVRTYRRFDGSIPSGTYGNFSFNGSMTGNAYADFLIGLPFSSTRINPILNRVLQNKELGLFITDTFKVSSRLTIDMGLRWDHFGSATYQDGLMYNWDPATGNFIVPQSVQSQVTPLFPSNLKVVTGPVVPHASNGNFVPRLAAAYRLTSNTVIRGGYGIFNEMFSRFARVQGGGPFQLSESFQNAIQTGVPLFQFPNPFPSAPGRVSSQSGSAYPMDTTNGKIHQFNLTVERQIHDVGVRLSYIGSRDRSLNYSLGFNKPEPSLIPFTTARRPYPLLNNASKILTDGATNYNSMLLEAKRHVGFVTFDAHWTWANSMTNYGNLENPYSHNFWNRDFIAHHRVVFNTLWELPFGKGRRYMRTAPGVVNHVLGGWTVAWVAFFQTGQYFTPSFSGSDPSNTNSFGGRPDRIANGNLPTGQRNIDAWFDTSAFTVPPVGRFGNAGVNILQGPGLMSHNVTLAKRFSITERLSFHYQALMSNIFNHPNFTNPSANISVPGAAGVIGSTLDKWSNEKGGPRIIEMRVRLEF